MSSLIKLFNRPAHLVRFAALASVASALFFFADSGHSAADRFLGKEITRINFEGNVNVSDRELLDTVTMRPGLTLTRDLINGDLKAIFAQGTFSNARMEGEDYKDGVSVIIIVEERPRVAEVKVKGMHKLQEAEITETLPIRVGETWSENKAARSVQMILASYREEGMFNAAIKVTNEPKKNKENQLVVTFRIDEGEEMKVSKINLIGVKVLDPEMLRSAMELEEDGFIADGKFKEELFEKDKETILEIYRTQGYLDVELQAARYDIRWKNKKQDKRVVVITYKISEGDQYFFNGYSMEWDARFLNTETGKPLFTESQINFHFEYSNFDIGGVFNNAKYQKDRSYINYLYSQKGYILTRVIPERTEIALTEEAIAEKEKTEEQVEAAKSGIDFYNLKRLRKILAERPELAGKKFVHVHFRIAEGEKGYVENIIIKGNKKTLDKVIRRELLVKSGDLFNADLVQKSRERIFNLGYFKNVNLDYRPGSSEGLMNLIVEVEEQPTGTISLGGGYGTQTGFSIFAEVSENNLNGTGQNISSRVEFGPLRTSLQASWTEPWIFDRPWSLTLGGSFIHYRLFAPSLASSINSDYETAYYYKDAVGYQIGVGHRIGLHWGHYHRFSPEYSRAVNPSSLVPDSVFLLVEQGWQVKNRIVNGIYYDNRDNYFNTTQGFRTDLSMELIGNIIAGDDHYNRYTLSGQAYWWPFDYTFFNAIRFNMLRRWRIVFEHRGSLTLTQMTSPVYKSQDPEENPYVELEDKLFLGGYESLRGWNYYDIYYPRAWQDGGAHRFTYGTELRLPVEPSLLWIVFFADAGALYVDPDMYFLDDSYDEKYVDSINDSQLSMKNVSMDYLRYSYGFGFRLQIPIMPLRIYLAKRALWDRNQLKFIDHPSQEGYEFVFGIGDKRF